MHQPFESVEDEDARPTTSTSYLDIHEKRSNFRTPPDLHLSTISVPDDGYSSVMSSPVLPPEPSRPGTPLLNHMSKEEESSSYSNLLPTEPPPAFDPPSYRSVAWQTTMTPLPVYSRWGNKYTSIDLESTGVHYNQRLGLAAYGWKAYGVIIVVIVVTLVIIIFALTHSVANNN